jgi:hypothetical protein
MPEDQWPRTRLKYRVSVLYSIISNARGLRTKDQTDLESRWRVCAVYSIISNARGPGTKDQTEVESRWRVCAVYIIISNARGPRTKDQTEVESRWGVCAVYSIISSLFQMPEDQGPRTRLKWRVDGDVCSLQHHFKCQRTKDQGPD